MNLILPLLSVFASLFIFLLFKFANAYGDFILMSKRHIKREGIEHKVVWIIGGSRGIEISALDVTEESLKAIFNVNVLGTISLTRLLVPFMLRRGRGHYVVMSSAAGKTPAPGQAVYSASKYALNGYFHTLCSELLRKGIRVTVVCPRPIETSNASGEKPLDKNGS